MTNDQIELLVGIAHQLFNQHSVHEIMELDRNSARNMLYKMYSHVDKADVEGYLDIISELRSTAHDGSNCLFSSSK